MDFQNPLSNITIQSPNPDYIHVAYLFMGLGLLSVVKSPKTLMTVVGAYMLYQNLLARGKEKLTQMEAQVTTTSK